MAFELNNFLHHNEGGTTSVYDGVPIGTFAWWFGPEAAIPSDWLKLNGEVFDRSVYPELYTVLGTNILPNVLEKVIKGSSLSGTNYPEIRIVGTSFSEYQASAADYDTVHDESTEIKSATITAIPIVKAVSKMADAEYGKTVTDVVNITNRYIDETALNLSMMPDYTKPYRVFRHEGNTTNGSSHNSAAGASPVLKILVPCWIYIGGGGGENNDTQVFCFSDPSNFIFSNNGSSNQPKTNNNVFYLLGQTSDETFGSTVMAPLVPGTSTFLTFSGYISVRDCILYPCKCVSNYQYPFQICCTSDGTDIETRIYTGTFSNPNMPINNNVIDPSYSAIFAGDWKDNFDMNKEPYFYYSENKSKFLVNGVQPIITSDVSAPDSTYISQGYTDLVSIRNKLRNNDLSDIIEGTQYTIEIADETEDSNRKITYNDVEYTRSASGDTATLFAWTNGTDTIYTDEIAIFRGEPIRDVNGTGIGALSSNPVYMKPYKIMLTSIDTDVPTSSTYFDTETQTNKSYLHNVRFEFLTCVKIANFSTNGNTVTGGYRNSNVRNYLTLNNSSSGFLRRIPKNIRDLIVPSNVECDRKNNAFDFNFIALENEIFFLPAAHELCDTQVYNNFWVGVGRSLSSGTELVGACSTYYSKNNSATYQADTRKIRYDINNNACQWWTRSLHLETLDRIIRVDTNGSVTGYEYEYELNGYAPAFVIG